MHVAITGASSGIGEALAREFGTEANKLSLVARRTELLNALGESLAAQTSTFSVDLSAPETACDWLVEAEQRHGPIDILINNAGMQYVESTLGITDERAEKLYRLNVLAPLRLIRRIAPAMVARGNGTVVNVASIAAITFAPAMADYSASKSALAAFSETLSDELQPKGVHVLTVYPGPVTTAMETTARGQFAQSKSVDVLPTGDPTELARLIRAAIDKRSKRLIYPRVYGITRQMTGISQWFTSRFAPRLADK